MQLAVWSAAFAVGIAWGIAVGPPSGWPALAGAGLICAALVRLRAWNLALTTVALAAGVAAGGHEAQRARSAPAFDEDAVVEVLGRVVRGADVNDVPVIAMGPADASETIARVAPGPTRAHLRLAVDTVAGQPVAASLSLTVVEGVPDVAPGDRVRFESRIYLPRGFANPGLPDARLVALGQGIELVASVRRAGDVRRMDGRLGPLAYARRLAFLLRRRMGRAIDHGLAEPLAGFVRTMVVGERTTVPAQIEDGFRAAGATHVLSVSGLHLAVVVALVFQLLRRLAARFPAAALRCPPRVIASVLALPVTAFYTLLTGEALATVRSAVMATLVLGASIVNRPLSLAAGIGAAALFVLAQAPAALLDVSFQLSFASVIGLGLFARWLVVPAAEPVGGRLRALRRWLVRSISASLAACSVTMPIVAHHFGEVTPAAPVGNLVIVPIVELVVLPLGLAGALLGTVHPWLGAVPLFVAGLASRLALGTAELFRTCAPVLLVRCPNLTETLVLVATAGLLLRGLARGAFRRRRWLVSAALAALLATGSMLGRDVVRRSGKELRVTFLDVGQGDAALIEGPAGFVALVDGGGRYDGSFDTGARIVEPVLRAAGITRLDLVVLSHPHPDHMNGLFRILDRFPVGALWTSGDDGHNPAYAQLVALARARGVPRVVPASFSRGQLAIEALGPWLDGRIAVPPGLSTNDGSLVLGLRWGRQRLLLTGDIGSEGEAELLDRRTAGVTLAADVLKVPHHGSRHASSSGFLSEVSPRLAVVSVGRFNRFGLPSPAATMRYEEHGIELLRTDQAGAVTIAIDGQGGLRVLCQRGCGGRGPDATRRDSGGR